MVLYKEKDSEKIEKQSTRWRKVLTENVLCNSVIIFFLVA